MKKRSFKERFSYWFDNRMSKGSLELIKLLTIATVFAVLLIGFILLVSGFSEEEGIFPAFWDSFSWSRRCWTGLEI